MPVAGATSSTVSPSAWRTRSPLLPPIAVERLRRSPLSLPSSPVSLRRRRRPAPSRRKNQRRGPVCQGRVTRPTPFQHPDHRPKPSTRAISTLLPSHHPGFRNRWVPELALPGKRVTQDISRECRSRPARHPWDSPALQSLPFDSANQSGVGPAADVAKAAASAREAAEGAQSGHVVHAVGI